MPDTAACKIKLKKVKLCLSFLAADTEIYLVDKLT